MSLVKHILSENDVPDIAAHVLESIEDLIIKVNKGKQLEEPVNQGSNRLLAYLAMLIRSNTIRGYLTYGDIPDEDLHLITEYLYGTNLSDDIYQSLGKTRLMVEYMIATMYEFEREIYDYAYVLVNKENIKDMLTH